jgi:folate-binding protein YgfZ
MLYFFKIRFDFLKFEGSDRLDLINRLSTNEVNSLEKFKGVKTILTSDKGRIIDILTLFNFNDFVFVTCSAGNSSKVLAHLEKYTIMDDFKAVNMTGSHEAVLFYGDEAHDFSNKTFFIDPARFSNSDFNIYVEDERHAIVARNDDGFGGILFIYAVKDKQYWNKKIFSDEVTSKFHLSEVSDLEFESERIELGIPAIHKEMSDSRNPLECSLGNYVNFTKGCYIGQEVIARLDAYDKISRHLVGIKTKSEITDSGVKIIQDGIECGFITSSAYSEKHGYISLGFIKTVFLDYTKSYHLIKNDLVWECTISKLPF